MNAEQLAQLKLSAERAQGIAFSAHLTTPSIEYADLVRDATPTAILDLIAEVERQAKYIADLKHDMDAAVKFCDEHHR